MDVKLPSTPFSGIDKISIDQFVDTNMMDRISKDVNKDNWPHWISTLLQESDHSHVYPLMIKDSFHYHITTPSLKSLTKTF